jgi:two-component system, OmpR family, phosphate regulon sensor histidine kinase PhoR
MKHVLFRRIFLAYLITAPLLLLFLELYLSSSIKDNYITHLKSGLIIQANLISDQIPAPAPNDLDDFCKRFKEKTAARITIIDDSGRVLGDSDEPSVTMENHSDRPEIKEAAISGVGSSIRRSKTLKKDLFYLAVSTSQDSGERFLRLSIPLHDVENAMNVIRLRIIIASLAVSLVVIVFGLIQVRRITKSVEEITDFSKGVAAGDFKRRLLLAGKDELGELGKNISEMARELHERLTLSEEEKRRFEAILKNMSDGLILTDTKGKIILVNDALKNLFGIPHAIEGKTVMETLRKAELMEVIEEVAASRGKTSRGIEITTPKELYLMMTAAPFYSQDFGGDLSGIVLTFHDITRLKKLEEVRKDFVANVSHEIKTPITAIKGFAETLIEGALDDKEHAKKFLETIKNHSERLNSLVSDLLTLSGIELGDIQIAKQDVNIGEVIDAVFTTLGEKARSKGLYLKKQIPAEISTMRADRDRLIQILLNLVDNGIKFTEKGGITITVKSEKVEVETEGEKEFIQLTVADTGSGIPQKHLSRLGERFYRVDRARSRELGGTGLGLAIVKHLVKAHGWEMKIESEETKGAAVHILCPIASHNETDIA